MSLPKPALDARSQLPEILGSPALSRLLIHFTLHPFEWIHFRELKRRSGLANRSLQLQIRRLLELGMIRERRDNRMVQYTPDTSHQGWVSLKPVIRTFCSPVEVFSVALGGANVRAAWLHTEEGSWGTQLQVVIDSETPPSARLSEVLSAAGHLAGFRSQWRMAGDACDTEPGTPIPLDQVEA